MYYLIYGFLKLLSLLPLRVLYLLGDFFYLLIVYVFDYRKKVVMNNLLIAFPEKTNEERTKIMKEFYHNFFDTIVEIIKIFSWSNEELLKRMEGNFDQVNEWKGKGRNVQVITGHYFNWELANLGVGGKSTIPFLGVYKPLSNKVLNRIFLEMRSRTGTILISATDFKNDVSEHLKEQYALILVGDQNPGNPKNSYWLNFFTKAAPFVKGPAKGAIMKDTVVFYADFYKVKRGYYHFEVELVTENPHEYTEGSLTKLLVKKVEASVKKRPANYLWTHRRWKHDWKDEYQDLWVDDDPRK